MYATEAVNFTDTETIYALVQCTTDLSPDDCKTCLETAISNTSTCCSKSRGARLFSRSCFLRYEFYAFYEDASKSSTENQRVFAKSSRYWMIVGLAIGSAIIVVPLVVFCVYCFAIRNQTKTKESQVSGQEIKLHEIGDPNKIDVHHQNLQARDNLNSQNFPFIDLVTLSAATDNFSASNKFGQGGFGPVYKGQLLDGREVAVKRLSSCSEQGLDEFTNEVLLILKLQHKNLVRLLGFCVNGEEKLLIYEYMPNGSLDVFLFDPRKRAQMNWSRRLNIINGIARTLLSNTTISTTNSIFDYNLEKLLDSLSSNASVSKFYTTKMGNDQDRLLGLFLCYNFVPTQHCENCIASAIQDIKNHCENRNEAVVWEENCQLRYSNESFFGTLDVTGNIPQYNLENVSDDELGRFISVVNNTLHKLSRLAAFNASYGMYATEAVTFTDTKTIYALVQCTADLSPDDCNTCLETAIANTSTCCSKSRGARLFSRSCFLRYEFYAFYEDASKSSTENQRIFAKSRRYWMIVGLAIGSAIIIVALVGFCVYCLAIRNQTKTKERQVSGQEVQIHEIGDPNKIDVHHQNLQARDNLNSQNFPFIDLVRLSAATDNFSASNKLGQGGFGPVYKGQLLDGREVAVKRLSSCSEQGLDEFTNEVLLILKLQHKNLVRLLGFCIDGEEKLLIYEYMPNGSLDVFLFDPRKRAQMNWSRRLNIINGIARGMLYLHEDSRLRIIHRDLKPSNVLLDSELNPKISDFGMARIFGGSDGATNTSKIVGTYGYMAPEFAMEGLYSIKSDVFSFGVLLIEILTGRRNANFHLTKCAPSLIAYVWQLWNEGKGLELIDPLLPESCDLDEFLRYMHIGLLCVQEDAYDRPTMSSVVVMLKSEVVTLSQPERPAFSVGRFTDHYEPNDKDYSVNESTISDIMPQ
ncbi:cysteine-rich receptor-like protein kinase 10 [Camellia sinensis]|uniref:cysteine-rich receptor-like protein kinase 10 n=1 Tax=Camellia sinensis TaxID=4442 RepID=UPI001035903F|nr:cysteine-rich receptor-like protein kinase 10 [Camellia sinensis]